MATTTTSSNLTKRETYERTRAELLLERSTFESHWRECGDFILPRRTRFFVSDKNKGDRRSQKIIDSTATFAVRTLRSGMHAGISSPARPWMRLTTPDPELAEYGPVKDWLHTVTNRMLTVFLKSNLYNVLPMTYGDMAVFGTAAMCVEEDADDLFRCYSYPIGSYALGVSERQIVDTCVREWTMTVRQLVQTFGRIPGTDTIDWSNISAAVQRKWDRGEYEQNIEVCWIICPNPDHDPSKLGAQFKAWGSYHFEKGTEQENKFLRESGFDEFPILAPRWDVTGEDIYGTASPGMDSLGDIKALQIMQKRKAQAVEKMVNPPLQGPTALKSQKVSMLPGDMTYVDVLQAQHGIRPIHEISLSVADITNDIRETQYRINESFFVNLFLMLASSDAQDTQRTAREIDERHEEKLLMLGPVLERTNDELLDPLVDRVYAIMDRAGMIPPAPPDLEGVDLKVEYISLMAQAQKLVGVAGLDRFFASTVPLMEAFPEVKFKINAMQSVDDYGDMLGVNPKMIVPDDEAEAAEQQMEQAMAQQRQAELAATTAKGAKDLSQTDLETDNALRRMVEG
jgi:Bacteriophage head to tail connecting protein.